LSSPNPEVHNNAPQRLAAVLLSLFGATYIALALQMPMGTHTRMGPGFMPAMFGVAQFALSLWLLLRPPRYTATADCASTRPALTILAAIVLFALSIDATGGLPAAALLGILCTLSLGVRPWLAIMAGAAIGCGTLLLFVFGLGVRIPLLPAFG